MRSKKIIISVMGTTEFEKISNKKVSSTLTIIKQGNQTALICNRADYVIAIDAKSKEIIYMRYKNKANIYETVLGSISLYGIKYFTDNVESNNINFKDQNAIKELADEAIFTYNQIGKTKR